VFGTDSAHYISMSFDHATANELSADEAFQRFADAYKENEKRFDRALKKLVLETASAIADAFAHKNRAELTKLARIKTLFRDRRTSPRYWAGPVSQARQGQVPRIADHAHATEVHGRSGEQG